MFLKILLGAAFSGSLHLYVWWRLVKNAHLARRWHIGLSLAMLLMWLSIPITTTGRLWSPSIASALSWISMPWMALVGLMFVVSVAIHVSRGVAWASRKALRRESPPESMSRRVFLARVTSGAAVTVAGASVARGMTQARGDHEIVTVEFTLPKLPKELDGFTIVQLSDLHVGLTIDRDFVQHVVDQTNRLSPDLIALTGDLVDGPVKDLEHDIAPLGSLRAKHGVYAVTGNHEYYAGADAWIAAITNLGVRYLRNQLVTIGDGTASFDLAGVDDYGAADYRGHGEDLKAATAARDPNRALVLLAHQPRQVRNAAKHGVDLQLSGHTHGGQIWPWHYIVRVQQGGLLAGRYTYEGTQVYVSRGCGYWGPPVRLLAPLEITRVVLRSA
ncbi:MAG: metallophosphoesterase [Kofleriaceae bacterium]|nr:metallophosphoesterase [Kofleriaceae bacterium]